MNLSECLKMLHSYIGTDCDKQDYIVYIQTLIMRAPMTPEEEKDDDNDSYYPYKGKTEERDFLLRIYNGRPLPKKKARMIKKYYVLMPTRFQPVDYEHMKINGSIYFDEQLRDQLNQFANIPWYLTRGDADQDRAN